MGRGLDEAQTKEIVDTALESGINFFDTADKYGETRSETYLGRAIKNRRDQVVVATKFGLVLPDQPDSGGGSAKWIKQAVKQSLQRLDLDHIDLYQLHRPDPKVELAETMGALTELVRQGLVREIGVSNATADDLGNAKSLAGLHNFASYKSVQNEYSMIRRDVETNGVLEFCEKTDTAFVPYYPLASGLLTGKYRNGQPDPTTTRLATIKLYQDWFSDGDRQLAKNIVERLIESGYQPLSAAIQWILRKEAVASVITGASRPEQVRDNARAVEQPLSKEDLGAISAIIADASS